MVSLEFLRTVSIFSGLNNDQLESILKGCHEIEYKKGDILFKEQEDAGHLWIVLDGQVDIRFDLPGRTTSPESNVYSETSTKTFGWSSFVPPYKYILSAYCAGKSCKIVRLDKEYLTRLFESDSLMGFKVMSNLAGIISMRFHHLQKSSLGITYAMVKITVHMATCGIAAGAREIMNALQEELSASDRHDIRVESSGCIGRCSTEPNVTVEIEGESPVIYQHMTPDKMRRVFKEHIIKGNIQKELVIN